MGFQPHDFEKEWQGLEPGQPEAKGRGWRWVIGLVLVLVGVCILAMVLVFQRFWQRTAVPGPSLNVPTSPAQGGAAPTNTPSLQLAPTVTTPSDSSVLPLSNSNVEAARLTQPLQIDGDLADWPQVTTVSSVHRVYNVAGWDGTEDLTAVWQVAWDNDYLYFGVTVTDDVHVQIESGNQIFRGDSVDIQLDTNRANSPHTLTPDNFQVSVSPGNFSNLPPSAFLFRGTNDNQILDAPGQHSILVAARRTDSGYVLETAVPWRDLETVPSTGLVLGAALNANDNDTPGTAVQEVMMSTAPNRTLRTPSTWGTLTLK